MTHADIVAEALAHAEKVTPEHFAPKNEDPDDAHAVRYVTTIEGGSCLDGKEATLAEAIAWAEDPGGENSDWDGHWCQYPDHVVYARRDVLDAALAHLAARVVAERERAERAHERAAREETATLATLARVDELRAALGRVLALSHDNEGAWEAARDALAEDEAKDEAPRG